MKELLLTCFLLATTIFPGQSQNALEANFSTNWSYFSATSNFLIDEQVNNLYMMESPLVSFSGDIFFRTLLKKKWLVKAGIGFQTIGYQFDNNSNSFLKEKLLYQQLTTSFLGGYYYGKKKWSHEIFIGIKPSYIASAKKTIRYTDAKNGEVAVNLSIEPSSLFNISPVFGSQFNYAITQKIDISLGITGELYLIQFNESPLFQKQYYLYQLRLGGAYLL
jgi:hypothetical protein